MSRKRDRASAVVLPTEEGDGPCLSSVSACSSNRLPSTADAVDGTAVSFGSFLWNDVSILLFYRLMHEVQGACLSIAEAPRDMREEPVKTLEASLGVVWAVAQRHLTPEECEQNKGKFQTHADALVQTLRTCVHGAEATDAAALCRLLLRLLEEQGFPEVEFGPLSSLQAELFLQEDVQGYSYSERATLAMPVPLRYDGDKRTEEEHSRKRVGYEVVLPAHHKHPEINTLIQLSEPKKRKPALDEYRIFSRPKKAASFAADDFMVDDELLHRAYVMLSTHLDAYGSLHGLTPYARLLLWNLLERNDALFNALYDQHVASETTRQQLLRLKELVAVHKAAFEATRPAARRAAGVISWYAASAQWRDQALHKLEEMDEADWYWMADVYRSGGRALFPNYAQHAFITHLAVGAMRKLDRLHRTELDGAPPVHVVVEKLLLPLLQGKVPEMADFCFAHNAAAAAENVHWHRRRRKLRTAMEEAVQRTATTSVAAAAVAGSAHLSSSSKHELHVYLCASLIFPLQCLGELLELCSLVMFSPTGFEVFTRSFLATNWEEEDTILAYLLRREPTNPSLVPLVGLPRLYRDFVTAIQLLVADKMLPYVVEARRLVEGHPHISLQGKSSYPYWKALASTFIEEDRFDDLCSVRVSTRENTSCLYTMAELERTPKIWAEDLKDLQAEEEQYRRTHDAGSPAEKGGVVAENAMEEERQEARGN